MSLWSRIFGGGSKYEDDQLVSAVTRALADDPIVDNPELIDVTSEDGVITMKGRVDKDMAKDHIEGAAREALRYKGLEFVRIDNAIEVRPKQKAV